MHSLSLLSTPLFRRSSLGTSFTELVVADADEDADVCGQCAHARFAARRKKGRIL